MLRGGHSLARVSRDSAFIEENAALYVAANSLQPTAVQRELIAETAALDRVSTVLPPISGGLTIISLRQ